MPELPFQFGETLCFRQGALQVHFDRAVKQVAYHVIELSKYSKPASYVVLRAGRKKNWIGSIAIHALASMRRPASVIRTRATSINLPPATTRSVLANPARKSSICKLCLQVGQLRKFAFCARSFTAYRRGP